MGFHWEWCAIKATGPEVLSRAQELRAPPVMVATGLTFEEVHKTLDSYTDGSSDWLAGCAFRGWTFLTGSVTFWGDDLVRIAKTFGADSCVAIAESTTWVLMMEYARPDGTVRRRSFMTEAAEGPDKMEFEVVMRGAGQEPMRRDEEGTEKNEGSPLPGEPLNTVIADDERLLKVLAAIGVPLQALQLHYVGDWDWKQMKEIPGPGRSEKAFTLFLQGPLRTPSTAKHKEKSLFGRLFRR